MRYTYTAIYLLIGYLIMPTPASAAEFCDDAYSIDVTLPNQARWDLCWEPRSREGISLHHIHYTPSNGQRQMILFEASLAQVHVPYDDNGSRFHDITDYGFGGAYLQNLNSNDCPAGTLLKADSKAVICQQIKRQGDAYRYKTEQAAGYGVSLFSASKIAEYTYIPRWTFSDDGSIEIGVGATGALQRFGTAESEQHGWLLETNKVGIAHLHNFFWRLDFDLGGTAENDYVEELNFTKKGQQLVRETSRLNTEAARSVDPNTLRTWRIVDSALQNGKGQQMAYEIELKQMENRDVGPSFEPFTHNDFYVTRSASCERFASHNTAASSGCRTNLSEFTNGQQLLNQDIVLWTSLSFYHMPKAEDAPNMDAHWSSFRLVPFDWHTNTPGKAGG